MLPLFVVPIVLLVCRAPRWGKTAVALLGVLTLATTYGLALAGRAGEITIAVQEHTRAKPQCPATGADRSNTSD